MFKPLSLFLGLRYVRSRHGNGFSSFISASSTIGIALGVMVLIVVLSAMNGFERELAQRLLSIVPHAEIIGVNEPVTNWRQQLDKVEENPHVIAAAPVIKMSGMMQKNAELKAVELRGVDTSLEKQVSSIEDYIVDGHWLTPATGAGSGQSDAIADNQVVLGAGIAKKLRVKIGDTVQILLPRQALSPQQQQQKLSQSFQGLLTRNLVVTGIFKFGGTVDDSLAYISLSQAADINNFKQGQVHGIRLKLDNVFQAPGIAREVAYQIDHYVYIYDWTRSQGHLFNDIQLVRMVMFIVLVLVIAVASFNIVSTLIMVVNEKKGDIAILKTMGAGTGVVMITFIIQGAVNGVLGSLIGALLGVYLALNLTDIILAVEGLFQVKFLSADVYFIDFLPSVLNWPDVYATVITALVMSLLATIYPAWRATKVEPAQVLGQL
ncbi:lipoprotein-releasing ABC transporter permease subunit LolE [Thalassomonas haliotis]|uniref:Lipoprotein-releasing ABC transporter permease subunit LolE n=1 Tax=Thalassomonas haliotis TaxID=485448 RepID=A0ABY7VK61_9GAMM|nr:lipoprotein-releasing ABC transporter permease subunit LolE [Thalassomonas haliotis]WDE13390.1 lipoprotein-releasing ABC transporter permease subunit LolE [Thalassomonas haliotis]